MAKLKVLHLISGGDSGGAKTHLFSLLDKLKELVNVRVGCLMEGVFYREILEKDIDSVLFRQTNRFDLSVVGDIADMINNEKFDILHVHGARANFVATFVKKKVNVPIVTTVHSDYLLDFDDFVKKLVFTTLNVISLRQIPYYIAVSDNFKDMLIDRGMRPNSIYTVYNGMDFSLVPKNPTTKEEYANTHGFSYDENTVYIGIAARFDTVKGVDVFLRAAKEVLKERDNVEFLVAGDGAEKENLLAIADGDEKIRFVGYEKDMYGFLNAIDINTLTSKCESFPYSMLEGAAMAKPMVASRVGGIPSLVKDYETGLLFESGNYNEMAQKLIELIDNKPLREELGKNIYNRATTLCTSEHFADTHLEIYNNIIEDFKSKKRYDFVVSGYYGFNNNGDDALLLALTEDLQRAKNNVRLLVLSNSPKETEKIYRVDSKRRMNPVSLRKAMKQSSVLLSGGGSLLQDATSSKSLWYYLCVIRLAKKYGLRVMQYANGFGPVTKKKNIELTKNTINSSVDVITLRDGDSFDEMERIGIKVNKRVTADPAVLLKGVDERGLNSIFKNHGVPEGEYISVSVREWKGNSEDFANQIAQALKAICEKHNLNAVFVPMQYPRDLEISNRVKSLMGDKGYVLDEKLSIAEAIGVIIHSKLNVAMRLHAMIYSVANGVRTVALRYDPKIDGFMKEMGLNNIVSVESVDKDELIMQCENAIAEDIDNKKDTLAEKARENTKEALELLNKAK